MTRSALSSRPSIRTIAYAIKNGIQRQLASEHPRSGDASFGHAISYFTPKPLQAQSHEAAVELAQLNGLQATLWGVSYPLEDGIAVEPAMSISPVYQDYRRTPREVWRIEAEGVTLSAGPPQLAITFAPATFSQADVRRYGDLRGIRHCPVDGGDCVFFSTFQIGRVFTFEGDEAVLRRGGIDYRVPFPNSEILASEAIDYAAMVMAYFRGNFHQTRDLARRLADDVERASTSVRIDALLYRGAAAARLGDLDAAEADFAAARELNPMARRTLRYQLMGEIARWQESGAGSDGIKALWSEYLSYYNPEGDLDAALDELIEKL